MEAERGDRSPDPRGMCSDPGEQGCICPQGTRMLLVLDLLSNPRALREPLWARSQPRQDEGPGPDHCDRNAHKAALGSHGMDTVSPGVGGRGSRQLELWVSKAVL